jgi:integrase
LLTTQLYFPDEPANRCDGLFRRELVTRIAETPGGLTAHFVSQAISMRGKQAKILSDDNFEDLLLLAETSRHPLRNKVIVLPAEAGLRAGEIASLSWAMVTDPTGAIGAVLELPDRAAKKRSGPVLPLHEDLRTALAASRGSPLSAGLRNRVPWPDDRYFILVLPHARDVEVGAAVASVSPFVLRNSFSRITQEPAQSSGPIAVT